MHKLARTRRRWVGLFASVVVAAPLLTALTITTQAGAVSPRVYAGSGVIPFGDAGKLGTPTTTLNSLVTAMAPTAEGNGYWLAASDGGVFTFGDAGFHGSAGNIRLSAPVVGIAPTPDGGGYWLVAVDGGVFSFGDAIFHGSMGAVRLNQPVVGMASTPDGKGYWLVAADGGIFTFGDAGFYGSTGNMKLNAPVVGMAATPDGKGYWLVAADGGIFTFGDAPFLGSLGNDHTLPASIVSMATTPGGTGYWLAGDGGGVYTFGDAPDDGGTSSITPMSPVTAIAGTPSGKGYWLLEPDDWAYSFAGESPYSLPVSNSIVSIASSQVQGDPDAGQGAYCNPYGPCEEWCALFATWVWRQAGIPTPSYPFTGSVYYWAQSNSVVLGAGQLAAPGDAILYGSGPQNPATSVHMGIVVQVWPDGAVETIEGDAGPAPSGQLAVIINGPFLPVDSEQYNGFGVYAVAQPTR